MEIAFSAQQQQQHWMMKVPEPKLKTVCTLYSVYTSLVRPSIHSTIHVHCGCVHTVRWAKATEIRIHFDQNHFPSFCIWSTNKPKKKLMYPPAKIRFSPSNLHFSFQLRHIRSQNLWNFLSSPREPLTMHIIYNALCVWSFLSLFAEVTKTKCALDFFPLRNHMQCCNDFNFVFAHCGKLAANFIAEWTQQLSQQTFEWKSTMNKTKRSSEGRGREGVIKATVEKLWTISFGNVYLVKS